MPNRDFAVGPAWKQHLENMTAEFTMKTADAERNRRTALRQIRHVERLVVIVRLQSAQPDQLICIDVGPLRGAVLTVRQILMNQRGRKRVESGSHRRMRREDVSGSRRPEGIPETELALRGAATRAFNDGERSVTFVNMANFCLRM